MSRDLHLPEVAILGAGRLASVAAELLLAAGAKVSVWARRAEALAHLPSGARPSTDLAKAATTANVVLFAVPAGALAEVAEAYGAVARGDQLILHAARGVGPGFTLAHQLIRSRTAARRIVALGGPLHARELHLGRPLFVVAGSRYPDALETLAALLRGTPARLHVTADIVGVEVAGAISNVTALALGMAAALDLGETARGVLLSHGLAEAQKIGVRLGAEPGTFGGLAGIGDLIPRQVSSTDRNLELGARLARGEPLSAALEAVGPVEGVASALAAAELARPRPVESLGLRERWREPLNLPLISAVERAILGQQPAREALDEVLSADLEELRFDARR